MMNESKIAAMPLEACGYYVRDKYKGIGDEGGGGMLVADCSYMSNGSELAALFAAAPELLAACQMAAKAIHEDANCDCDAEDPGCPLCNAYVELCNAMAKFDRAIMDRELKKEDATCREK